MGLLPISLNLVTSNLNTYGAKDSTPAPPKEKKAEDLGAMVVDLKETTSMLLAELEESDNQWIQMPARWRLTLRKKIMRMMLTMRVKNEQLGLLSEHDPLLPDNSLLTALFQNYSILFLIVYFPFNSIYCKQNIVYLSKKNCLKKGTSSQRFLVSQFFVSKKVLVVSDFYFPNSLSPKKRA